MKRALWGLVGNPVLLAISKKTIPACASTIIIFKRRDMANVGGGIDLQ